MFGVLMLPLGMAQRWVVNRSGGYSLAEHYAFLLYLLAQSVLVLVLLQLALLPLGSSLAGGIEGGAWFIAFLAYLLWAGPHFYLEPRWRVALKSAGALATMLAAVAGITILLSLLLN